MLSTRTLAYAVLLAFAAGWAALIVKDPIFSLPLIVAAFGFALLWAVVKVAQPQPICPWCGHSYVPEERLRFEPQEEAQEEAR